MMVIKYYCDMCEREVQEDELREIPFVDTLWDKECTKEDLLEKEICFNCIERISDYIRGVQKENKK